MTVINRMRVCVDGWRYSRAVIVKADRVLMEVARTSNNCHHCPTCTRRVNLVRNRLNQADVCWEWEYLHEGGMWASLKRKNGQDPIALIRSVTGLRINEL